MSDRENRLARANALLVVIASTGRRFFAHRGAVSRLELRGSLLWWCDSWREGRRPDFCLHRRGWRRRLHHGGTMQNLIEELKAFVLVGTPVPAWHFGPWPERMCGGDLWGYGEDMAAVRLAARALTGGDA